MTPAGRQAFEPAAIETFAAVLPPRGPLLALDLGTKTIGVAVSDIDRQIGSPLVLIRRTKFGADADALAALAAQHRAVGFILGLPLNMDGSEGPRAQATRAFARNFAARTALPIAFWDERLSTAAAERMLIDADRSRARRAELVDKTAAAWVLQGALDRMG
jgi:putative Holliday junction resolvase